MAALEAPEDIVEDLAVPDLAAVCTADAPSPHGRRHVAPPAPEPGLLRLPVPCDRRHWRHHRDVCDHVLMKSQSPELETRKRSNSGLLFAYVPVLRYNDNKSDTTPLREKDGWGY